MYKGPLVTLKLKNIDTLLCKSITEINIDLDENNELIVTDVKNKIKLGNLEYVSGMDLEKLLLLYNFELNE